MKYNKLFIIISIVFILMSLEIGFASCPIAFYKVKGEITTKYKQPIGDVSISIFFDDDQSGYGGLSSSDGRYEIIYLFDTYKEESKEGDICGKTPSKVKLIFFKEDYFSKNIEYPIVEIKTEDNGLVIPRIFLIEIDQNTVQFIKESSQADK